MLRMLHKHIIYNSAMSTLSGAYYKYLKILHEN